MRHTLTNTSFDRNFVIHDVTAMLPSTGRWSGSSRTYACHNEASALR